MKKDINNIFMIFIAVIAIAAILAFMTNFNTIVSQDNYTEETTEHTHSYTVTKVATCTASGTETCSCGETQTIEALGHKYASLSCGNNPCTRCNENYYMSHEWGENVVFVNPTCTQAGTGGCVCLVCGVEDRSIYLYPTGHSDKDGNGNCDGCGTKI